MKTALQRKIILHADVGRDEGWGHFRELISVAKILRKRGVEPAFAVPLSASEARQELKREKYVSLDSTQYHKWASGNFVVSDLIHYSKNYIRTMRNKASGWSIITEHRYEELSSINFNICTHPEFMPLHRQYQNRPVRKLESKVKKVFICFGGADPKNATGFVLECLRQKFERGELHKDFLFTVLLGPLFEHTAVVKAMERSYPVPIKVFGPVKPEKVMTMVLDSDLAITTGGGTMYEFCALGVPSLIVPVLDKMDANASVLEKVHAVVRTPRLDYLSSDELCLTFKSLLPLKARKKLSGRGQKAVDGRGAERIVETILKEWRIA